MPLTFMRVDAAGNVRRIWYRDEFGQPRFFALDMFVKSDGLAKELIRQVNELLARPRPAEPHCRIRKQEELQVG